VSNIIIIIGVAIYGALGHVSPSTSNCLFFSGHFRASQTLDIRLYVVSYPEEQCRPIALSPFFCTNFVIFLCVPLNYFLSASCTQSWRRHWLLILSSSWKFQ